MKLRKQQVTLEFVLGTIGVVIVFVIGLIVGSWLNNTSTKSVLYAGATEVNYKYIQELIGIIDAQYIKPLDDFTQLTHGAAKGIVNALDDGYSTFLDPQEAEKYLESNDTRYEGVGIQLGFKDQNTVVQTPFDSSPAKNAGVRPGDVILEVDGKDVTGLRPEQVAPLIRGERGTMVEIGVFRPISEQLIKFEIERASIDLDNVTYEKKDNGVIVINVTKFTEGEQENRNGSESFINLWDTTVNEIEKLNPKGIVIDLRFNPGGYVSAVQHVAEEFLATGDIIMREDERGKPQVIFRDSREGAFEDIPLAVVVNEGSASAAEILAAAIQENERGLIIGKTTTGKGVEQRIINFGDGSLLLLVFRKWLTPAGNQIDVNNPIVPDKIVDLNQQKEVDLQLQAAINTVQEQP